MQEVEAICQRVLIIAYGRLRLDSTLDAIGKTGSLEDRFMSEVEAAGRELKGAA
jgi:ABC-type Na+ transport system ATPase subunit NatA